MSSLPALQQERLGALLGPAQAEAQNQERQPQEAKGRQVHQTVCHISGSMPPPWLASTAGCTLRQMRAE